MNSDVAPKNLDDLALLHKFDLEELLDRAALAEMTQSFAGLFGIALRVYSATGALLADAERMPRLYSELDKSKLGRKAVQQLITVVRRATPEGKEPLLVPCVSGGHYLISSIEYEGRLLGRIILGPFLEPGLSALPDSLLQMGEDVEPEQLKSAWNELPRLSGEEARRLDAHVRATLDLLVFSGLKAHMASSMHVASVQESFRELSDKNKKLEEAYERLKELDRLKSNFLATVSHELRTPLTSIIGYSEMIIEGIAGEINEEQRDFLNTIHEKGEQLLELIKSLLDLSKLESGTMSLRRADTDCGRLAEQVVSTMTPAARKRGVTIEALVEQELPTLFADADRLRQVLNNLCENALKFTPEGGKVTIAVSKVMLSGEDLGGFGSALMAPAGRPAIQFAVRDTGIGVPKDKRDRVFDAFYQVDNTSTREVGGTGLGLSIVKRLVDAHDGTVVVEGNEPQGAVFLVTLPIFKKP
jgi:two-component system, NarL family, sensor histidine kinase BarA